MSAPRWVLDEQYRWPLALILVLSYAWAVMPSGLQWETALAEELGIVGETDVGPWFKVQWLPLFALSGWILLRRYPLLLGIGRDLNPFLYALVGWICLSALWAPDAGHVLRQAIIIVGVAMMATAQVVAAWQPGRFETILRWTLLGLAAASAVVALARPAIGVHQLDAFELQGSWRGVATTKYLLGHVCQFSALLWIHGLLTRRVRWQLAVPAILFSLFVLLRTRSNTSLLVLLLGLAVMVLSVRPPLRRDACTAPFKLTLLIVVALPLFAYLIVVGSLQYEAVAGPVARFFGKDVTLSGRLFIWEELWRSISASVENFWRGVGYMSFWNGPGSLADEAYRRLAWITPDGHSGYLDIWNELGLVGLGLLAGFLLFHFRSLVRLGRFDPGMHGLHLAILIMVSLENLMASGWFRPVAPSFLLAVYSSLAVSRRLYEQRLRASRLSRVPDRYPAATGSAAGT